MSELRRKVLADLKTRNYAERTQAAEVDLCKLARLTVGLAHGDARRPWRRALRSALPPQGLSPTRRPSGGSDAPSCDCALSYAPPPTCSRPGRLAGALRGSPTWLPPDTSFRAPPSVGASVPKVCSGSPRRGGSCSWEMTTEIQESVTLQVVGILTMGFGLLGGLWVFRVMVRVNGAEGRLEPFGHSPST